MTFGDEPEAVSWFGNAEKWNLCKRTIGVEVTVDWLPDG